MNRYDRRVRADARDLPIADESVQCVVTSPPYFGLRKYDVDGPQIGMESDPNAYIKEMVTVFRDVWRVLKSDGVLWLNIGDSYSSSGGMGDQGTTSQRQNRNNVLAQKKIISQRPPAGLKPKDLVGIPWLLAFALRADGWYLRQEIIWHKSNCMPESVADRPTRAHEQIFLLTKSEQYKYDADAIKEKASTNTHARFGRQAAYSGEGTKQNEHPNRQVAGFNERWKNKQRQNPKAAEPGSRIKANTSFQEATGGNIVEYRNKRSVWNIISTAYSEAHYATFPPKLVEPCILAGSKPGDFVLDPFAGSGTVAMVAEQFGRRWVAVDLGYQDLQKKRLTNIQPQMEFQQ